MEKKIGSVAFEHHEEFKGDVIIKKGDASVKVSMAALREFVGEAVRFDLLDQVQKMKPSDLLKRLA